MQQINEQSLEENLIDRFQYLTEFIGFGQEDIDAIHASAEALGPVVPALVDAVYEKLFQYSSTKRHFVPQQSGYDGPTPVDIDSLTLDHEQIAFRKKHLTNYLVALVSKEYDEKLVSYLDMVGKIHTNKIGSKDLSIPLVQMNALMGFVSDAIIATILSFNLPRETEVAVLRAFNKLLWIQNDLITRHYQAENQQKLHA